MKVSYNDTTEFIEEMRRDAHLIDRGIVRLTCERRVSKLSPNIRLVSVLAAFGAESIGQNLVSCAVPHSLCRTHITRHVLSLHLLQFDMSLSQNLC